MAWINVVAALEIIPKLGCHRGDPAFQGSWQGRWWKISAFCHQPYNIHQRPVDRHIVVGGFPAVSVLVVHSNLFILHFARSEFDPDQSFNALSVLDGGKQTIFLSRLKPLVDVI